MNPSSPSLRPRLLLVCSGNLSGRESLLADELATVTDLTIVLPDTAIGSAAAHGRRIIDLGGLAVIPSGERPDAIVYASPPTLSVHWKVWRWKRGHVPDALLGGHWLTPDPADGWPVRLAQRSLDFFFASDEASAGAFGQAGINPRRVLRAYVAGGAAAFLARRLAARGRSVLWVDEDISLQSPSTKPLVYSLPHLQAEGWEVRAWCLTTDVPAEALEAHRLPPPPRAFRLFTPFWFPVLTSVCSLTYRLFTGRRAARIIQTVGGNDLGADIAAIHFVNALWFRKQRELGIQGFKDALMLFWTALGAWKDARQFRNPRCRLFLPVSDSIADEVRRRCRPQAEVRTLPNAYDETRFNPEARQRWREPMRRELGFGAGEVVFVFASQGHYRRKGFWLAVEALERLRRRADVPRATGVRFLVVGGQPGTLDRLRAELTASHPGWEQWMVFVGSQAAMEKYLAAADAFLFPSYFEAFCLAEIEAGALGLPLLLTPHHGTEMILHPGVNGLTLPFDPAGIEAVLVRFLAGVLPAFTPSAGRAFDRATYASHLARIYQEFTEERLPAFRLHG